MTIEEKAKRYDKTIEKLREFYRDYDIVSSLIDVKKELASRIPELKDKEDEDEKIRKWCISHFRECIRVTKNNAEYQKYLDDKVIPWLEEQRKLENYNEAEKEKTNFVDDGFIKCYADFLDFEEGNTYWLEYIGDDKYNVRSDNLLGKTYHITPCQLYTVFKKLTWVEKQKISEATTKSVNKMVAEFADTKEECTNSKPVALSTENEKGKIEPKFHEGEWVVFECGEETRTLQIKEITEKTYVFTDNTTLDVVDEDSLRLWTINDAKDGDVLAISWWENNNFWEKIIIFKKYHNKGVKELYGMSCIEGYGNTFKNGNLAFDEKVPYYSKTWTCNLHPATKEQRDTLMKAMADAGYTFDFEKKELKKIEPKSAEWSEDDRRKIGTLSSIIFDYAFYKDALDENNDLTGEYAKLDNWLQSIPERFNLQPEQEWSEEEAANEYAAKTECAVVACRGFKAGAKWMSERLKNK